MTGRYRPWSRLVAVGLLSGVACTTPGPRGSNTADTRPAPATSTLAHAAIAEGSCPVTRPVTRDQVPASVVSAVFGDYVGPPPANVGHWYGNDAL